jgi:hypothetical protein
MEDDMWNIPLSALAKRQREASQYQSESYEIQEEDDKWNQPLSSLFKKHKLGDDARASSQVSQWAWHELQSQENSEDLVSREACASSVDSDIRPCAKCKNRMGFFVDDFAAWYCHACEEKARRCEECGVSAAFNDEYEGYICSACFQCWDNAIPARKVSTGLPSSPQETRESISQRQLNAGHDLDNSDNQLICGNGGTSPTILEGSYACEQKKESFELYIEEELEPDCTVVGTQLLDEDGNVVGEVDPVLMALYEELTRDVHVGPPTANESTEASMERYWDAYAEKCKRRLAKHESQSDP